MVQLVDDRGERYFDVVFVVVDRRRLDELLPLVGVEVVGAQEHEDGFLLVLYRIGCRWRLFHFEPVVDVSDEVLRGEIPEIDRCRMCFHEPRVPEVLFDGGVAEVLADLGVDSDVSI